MSAEVSLQKESALVGSTGRMVVALLAAILVTQIVIILRMPAAPPTIRAMRNATSDEARTNLLQSLPLVRVQGGSVEAEITGPVDVEVRNTPLEVAVYR